MITIIAKLLTAAAAFSMVGSVAAWSPGELSWLHSNQEKSAVASLAIGFSDAFMCNRRINTKIAKDHLGAAFDRSLSTDEVVQIMQYLVFMESALSNFPGVTKEEKCASSRKEFGPSGSIIRGLLD